ncbi:MAG: accessory gene regulator B family protein [Lachnospiraceae bacterium]|nr:accessory gene regulator B family protein [Lachnospiraceae bacterium]
MNYLNKKLMGCLGLEKLDKDEREIIEYSLRQFEKSLLGFSIALLVSYLMGIFIAGLYYIFAFSILRVYTGGYHAKKEYNCAFISFAVLLFSLALIKAPFMSFPICAITGLLCVAAIIGFAPVANANRKISLREKKVFKLRAVMISVTIYFTLFVAEHYENLSFVRSAAAVLISTAILLLAGLITNEKNEKRSV